MEGQEVASIVSEGDHESMDRGSCGNSLSPLPPNALNPPLLLPAVAIPRISERESQLASEVGRLVAEYRFGEALDKGSTYSSGPMATLMELRPDDPLVAANGCLIGNMAGKHSFDEFQAKLHSIYNGLITSKIVYLLRHNWFPQRYFILVKPNTNLFIYHYEIYHLHVCRWWWGLR